MTNLYQLEYRDLDGDGQWKRWLSNTPMRQQEADSLKRSAEIASVRDGLAVVFRTVPTLRHPDAC